ncbi:Hydrogenase 2 maturation protease [bacterium HR09]|nr:Hydrogenase 2 maturation protease [bacterium HR09]
MAPSVLVVGFGNPLMGDDGVGLLVIELLKELGVAPHVRLAEGGTDATVLAGLWQGEERVVLVDALVRGSPPGTIHRLSAEEVLQLPQPHRGVHALSLPECLRWVLLAKPELAKATVVLFGVEPRQLEPGQGLTPEVKAAAQQLARQLLQELAPAP